MGVSTVKLVSQAEYARQRGCTEGAVRRAVRDGRITLIEGKIDPVAADAQWQRNTRVRAGSRPTDDTNLTSAGKPAPRQQAEDEGDGSYWQSRARREKAEAETAELKLAELRGELVRAADVKAAHAKRLAGLREALLQIPSRLSAVMAAESDQARCFDAIQREVHGVLLLAAGE